MLKKSGLVVAAFLLVVFAMAPSPSAQAVERVTCNCSTNSQCGSGNACCRLPGRNCGICC